MADKTSPHVYQGNPGYVFPYIDPNRELNPGDVVDLTDAQAKEAGGDFAPVKPTKTPSAKAEATSEGADK